MLIDKISIYLSLIGAETWGFLLTLEDVREVVEKYDAVLHRGRKYGMRGNRNFTGKVEDEIRGTLAEGQPSQ